MNMVCHDHIRTDPVALAIEVAQLRGLDVRVIVPRRGDSRVVTAAARSYVNHLLKVGVRVFFHERGFVHAKTIVIDDTIAVVGSANMDLRSLRLNFEACVLVYDTVLNQQLATMFERDLDDCQPASLTELQQRSTIKRTFDELARLASPVL